MCLLTTGRSSVCNVCVLYNVGIRGVFSVCISITGCDYNLDEADILDSLWSLWNCSSLAGEIILAVFGTSNNHAATSAAVFFLFLHIGLYVYREFLAYDVAFLTTFADKMASVTAPVSTRAPMSVPRRSGQPICAPKAAPSRQVDSFMASLILLMAAPSAFDAIAWRYYFVFFSVPFCSIFIFAFYFPEVSITQSDGQYGREKS
jgi:hypothetical protein